MVMVGDTAADFAGEVTGQDGRQGFADVGLPLASDSQPEVSQGLLKDAGASPDRGPDLTQAGDGVTEPGARCNNLENTAPFHDILRVDGEAPVPAGGRIEEGTYYETAGALYGSGEGVGPTGVQRRMVMVVAGQQMQAAFTTRFNDSDKDGTETDTFGVTIDAGVGVIEVSKTCPSGNSGTIPLGYSAIGQGRGASFLIFFPAAPLESGEIGNLVITLTRQ